ncbi:MAG: hypothetical protein IKF79_01495 [Methanosphaera sp.]|nr:hypothetical protein [Methanosphaera sp.]
MADKEIIIDGKRMLWGTSAKASPETSTNTTQTFDGAITQGAGNIPWTIELEKVRYDNMIGHRKLSEKLDKMLTKPAMVTIRERVKTASEEYTIVDNFYNCILEGNDYELKPDENTGENIKFKAAKRVRKYEE